MPLHRSLNILVLSACFKIIKFNLTIFTLYVTNFLLVSSLDYLFSNFRRVLNIVDFLSGNNINQTPGNYPKGNLLYQIVCIANGIVFLLLLAADIFSKYLYLFYTPSISLFLFLRSPFKIIPLRCLKLEKSVSVNTLLQSLLCVL